MTPGGPFAEDTLMTSDITQVGGEFPPVILINDLFMALAGGMYKEWPHGLLFGSTLVHEMAHQKHWKLLSFLYAQGNEWQAGGGVPAGETDYRAVIYWHLQNPSADGTLPCIEAWAYKQSVRDACCRCKAATDPAEKADWDALAEEHAMIGWASHMACISVASNPQGEGPLPVPPEPELDGSGCPVDPQPDPPEGDPPV